MASARHGTLVANTVTTVTIDTTGDYSEIVDVINRSQSGEMYVTADGTAPTVTGNDTRAVMGVTSFRRRTAAPFVVKLISTAALSYSVQER